MATTTNYGWVTPDDTSLVKDGASAIRTLGSSVDTTTKNLNPETTLGDLSFRSSTSNVNTRIPIGTAGQHLTVVAGVPTWATASDQTPLTTKGDLFTFSTTDARLPVGTNNQVLIADSAEATGLKWATPSAGGMTLISETVASGLTALSFSSLGSYKQLMLIWSGLYQSATGSEFVIRFNSSSSSNYYKSQNEFFSTASLDNSSGTYSSVMNLIDNAVVTTAGKDANGYLIIDNYTSSTKTKAFNYYQFYCDTNTSNPKNRQGIGYFNDTTAITSIDVVRTTGSANFTNQSNTTIRLYGIN